MSRLQNVMEQKADNTPLLINHLFVDSSFRHTFNKVIALLVTITATHELSQHLAPNNS